jgi:hypothetical protein
MITSFLVYRNFLNQTGDLSTTWNLSIDNLTGSGSFGLSGVNGKYNFIVKSGEIYDPYDKLLGSYKINEPFVLQNNIKNSKDTLYFNNSAKFFFKESDFFTGNNYNYFFVDPSGLTIDFDFSIQGEATTLQASILNTRYKNDNTNQIINTITGRFINTKPNLNVKIFDAQINGVAQYSLSGFPLSFNDTGYFYILTDSGTNPINNNNITTLPIVANTNYGDIAFSLNVQNEYIAPIFHTFSISPSGNQNIQNNETIPFILQYGSSSGSSLNIQLNYISGTTGLITGNLIGTGYLNKTISGLITGSGFIEQVITDPITLSGYNSYYENYQYTQITGITAKQFAYATGEVRLDYSNIGTGLGTGYVYLDIPSSGQITVDVSGYVPYVGGGPLFYTTGNFKSTGYSVDINNNSIQVTGLSSIITNSVNVFYTGEISGVYLNTGQYSDKLFSGGHTGLLSDQEIISSPYYQLATGFGTGQIKTGIVNADFFRFFEGGNYFFTKIVTGISGYFQLSNNSQIITGLSGLLDCKFNDSAIQYSGIGKITGINHFNLFLDDCDTEAPIFYFLATGKPLEGFKLYASVGKEIIADEDIPKFIIMGVTGNESGFTYLENLNYLTGDSYGTGIRTRISHLGDTISGSGYFSGIFSEGACENYGVWEHNFVDSTSTIKTGFYYTNNYISSFSQKIISAEDNIVDNFNIIKFEIL